MVTNDHAVFVVATTVILSGLALWAQASAKARAEKLRRERKEWRMAEAELDLIKLITTAKVTYRLVTPCNDL